MLFINSQEPSKKKKKRNRLSLTNTYFLKSIWKYLEHLELYELAISSGKKNEIYKIFQNKF